MSGGIPKKEGPPLAMEEKEILWLIGFIEPHLKRSFHLKFHNTKTHILRKPSTQHSRKQYHCICDCKLLKVTGYSVTLIYSFHYQCLYKRPIFWQNSHPLSHILSFTNDFAFTLCLSQNATTIQQTFITQVFILSTIYK